MPADTHSRAVAVATARPGLSYAALARELGGRRASALALLRAAVEAGELHEAESRVPAGPSGSTRSVLGLFPGPAPQVEPAPPAADLLALRQQLGLSAAQIAGQLGISPGLLYHWENGRQPVPDWAARALPTAVELAQAQALLATRERPRTRAHRRALLDLIEARPGLTRSQLQQHARLASRSTLRQRLDPLLAGGRAHEAPVGAGRARGLFPGPAPLRPPVVAPADLREAAARAGWSGHRVARALGIPAPTWSNCLSGRGVLANLVTPERAARVMAQALEAGDALERRLLTDMPATRETLTRGRYGRSAAVEDALDRLLDSDRAHLAPAPFTNASGVTRHLLHLHAGPAPQVEPLAPADLTALRQSRGLTRPALADALGLSSTQIDHWENGRQPIPASRATQIRAHLTPLPERSNSRALARPQTDAEIEALALAHIAANPGCTARQATAAMAGSAQRRLAILRRLVEDGCLREEPGMVRGKPTALLHLA